MLGRVGSDHERALPKEAKSGPIEINGYAIVSDDDRIAGSDGLIPASLRNEKDWDCFQRVLAGSDLVVLGHRSHELAPNVRGDQRLVISRGAAGFEQRANVWWGNPARMSWKEVAKELLPRGGDVAVPGGQAVFDLFLKIRFDAFHLTRAHRFSPRAMSVSLAARQTLMSTPRSASSTIFSLTRNPAPASTASAERPASQCEKFARPPGSFTRRIDPFATSRRMTVFARRRHPEST